MTVQHYDETQVEDFDNSFLDALERLHTYKGPTISNNIRSTLLRDILHRKIYVSLGVLYRLDESQVEVHYSKRPVDAAALVVLYQMAFIKTDRNGLIHLTKNGEQVTKAILREFAGKK